MDEERNGVCSPLQTAFGKSRASRRHVTPSVRLLQPAAITADKNCDCHGRPNVNIDLMVKRLPRLCRPREFYAARQACTRARFAYFLFSWLIPPLPGDLSRHTTLFVHTLSRGSIRSWNGRVARVALCRAVGVVSFPIADPRNSRLVTIGRAHIDTQTSLASLTF